jgi:hypothetical protein
MAHEYDPSDPYHCLLCANTTATLDRHRPRTGEKWIVRLLIPVLFPAVCVLWIVLGVISPQRLGRVLTATGRNLQRYTW